MEIKILQVFYGKDGLPYKDKERSVHFPIVGTGFLGASNTTKIKFYYDELDNLDETTWVAVSKLPNGKVGSRVLESHLDSELNEHYALLELDNYYTKYKGDVFISLQGYQGGVDFDYDEENSQYEIHGTPTIAATGSIKFTINYANQFIGSGETDNINFQRILAALGTKLGMRAYSEHVEELPSEGSPDVFYVVNDDPNNPNLANIYVWNQNTRHYIWVGDNTLDLGNYYTKAQGEQLENDVNEKLEQQDEQIAGLGQLRPSGVTTSTTILAYTEDRGIWIGSDTGDWYYWDGTQYVSGGTYQATAIADGSVTIDKIDKSITDSLYDWENCNATLTGTYYTGSTKVTNPYNCGYVIDVTNIRYLKINAVIGQWYNEFTFVDENDAIISYHQCNVQTTISNKIYIVPNNATKCYISTGDTNISSFSGYFLNLDKTKKSLEDAEKIAKAIELKELPIQDIKVGYYNTSNVYSSHKDYRTVSYDVSLYKKVYISYDSFEQWLPTYILWKNGEIIYNSNYKGTSFSGWIDVSNADKISIIAYFVEVGKCSVQAYQITSTKQLSYWDGKKIVWFGTSIPAAGLIGYNQTNTYPNYVGNMLGANVYNEAVGSSAVHCRRYSKVSATNPYGFTENFATSSRALASSLEEKQWIINWLKAHLNGGVYEEGYENDCAFDDTIFTSGVPASLDADTIEFYKDCSYERKLDKYLGTNKRCDLYVLDHGYNDYTLDDVNFDENNPYDLHYFRGAMNFIIARILADNPRAKIVILTHYTDQIPSGQYNYKLTEYQIKVADDWNIDRLELYKKLGFSVKYKINTQWGWSAGYLVDTGSVISNVTVKSRWIQDDLHPHTDLTNECITFIARVVSTWLESDVRSGWY